MSGFINHVRRMTCIDLRSLALFRICLASLILYDLAVLRYPDLEVFYADAGILGSSAAAELFGGWQRWTVYSLDGSAPFQAAMMCVSATLAVLLLLGFQTRLATVGCWIMAVSVENRNPLLCNYGDTILQIYLLWSMFLPLGARWSLDALYRARTRGAPDRGTRVCSMASAAALLQLSIIYFFTGIWKWNEDWLSGAAAEQALMLEYARRPSAQALLEYSYLLGPFAVATLFLELIGPLVVWSPWRTNFLRMLTIVAFVALHVSIELLFMPVLLSYVCVAAWLLFLPTSFWDGDLWRRRAKEQQGVPRTTGAEEPGASRLTGRERWTRWAVNGFCLALLVFTILWNIATLDVQRFGYLVPPQVRWVGYVAKVRQTWDMFYRPSRHNGWFKAPARLTDGSQVDVLRNGESFDPNQMESNWFYLPNSRWKMFFRRLGTWDELQPLQTPVAQLLLDGWNRDRPHDERALELSLIYYERVADSAREGYVSRVMATVSSGEETELDRILRRLGGDQESQPLLD